MYECVTSSRRWQAYAARSFGVSMLLFAIALIAWSSDTLRPDRSMRDYAELGEGYFFALISTELVLVMLAAPAATAGAICQDRSRGTLAHVLATDLSDAEIVLGKLAARLLPVLGLVACTWPVLSITSLLGGIDPVALTMAFAVIIAVAVLGCSLALALSVWARKPHEVIAVVYTFWIVLALAEPVWWILSAIGRVRPPWRWVEIANPFHIALAAYAAMVRVELGEYLGFFAVTLGAACALAGLAIWRMRPVACRGAGETRKAVLGWLGRAIRRLPGPSLDGNPVLWREWHRGRPSRWMIILFVLVGGSTGIVCAVSAFRVWSDGITPMAPASGLMVGIVAYVTQVLIGLLVLSAVAPLSMSEERQRGSLDVLCATPLSTRTIMLGKWLGTFRLVAVLAICPGLVALAFATARRSSPPRLGPGPVLAFPAQLTRGEGLIGVALMVAVILAHGAAITSVGLAAATWLKRQSRAIAVSVGLFVMVAAAWPIAVGVVGSGAEDTMGVAALSPIFCTVLFGPTLAFRGIEVWNFFAWAAFWVVEVTLVAVAILWLSIRTYDRSFDRIPERHRTDARSVGYGLLWIATIVAACAAGVFTNRALEFTVRVGRTLDEADKLFGLILIVLLELVVLFLVALGAASARRHNRLGDPPRLGPAGRAGNTSPA
jgi:ABC-type transport system involved in multi-copper enzyme maturation permease subunit